MSSVQREVKDLGAAKSLHWSIAHEIQFATQADVFDGDVDKKLKPRKGSLRVFDEDGLTHRERLPADLTFCVRAFSQPQPRTASWFHRKGGDFLNSSRDFHLFP